MAKVIPVKVVKKDLGQCGDGYYHMLACFKELEVHVPYVFKAHSENDYLHKVGQPTPCDKSCYYGELEDWTESRSLTNYGVEQIIEVAKQFAEENKKVHKV